MKEIVARYAARSFYQVSILTSVTAEKEQVSEGVESLSLYRSRKTIHNINQDS